MGWSCLEKGGGGGDHAFRRGNGRVLRMVLDYEVEGEWKEGRPKWTWKKWVEKVSVKVGYHQHSTFLQSTWSVGGDHVAAGFR